jgi:hypothetical protein
VSEFDYKAFFDRVGLANGWDFSEVKCETEGHGLNLYAEVVKRTTGSELLLDVGTGGGEAVLSISSSVLLAVGIDNSTGMISTANKNLINKQKPNVRFLLMDASNLNFPDGFFDLVTCRHSDFSAAEVPRVLGQGGVFMTQQVSENDKSNIKEFFGRGQAYGTPQDTLRKQYLASLQDVGFNEIQTFESNVTEYYSRREDLIFLLKHTPIVPDFGDNDDDFKLLDAFIQAHMTDRGIATNASRFMIVANK